MTNILGNVDLDKLKPSDLLRVVRHGKKDIGLEKVEAGKTVPVLLEMPKGLHRVMLSRSTLFNNSLNQEIIELLDEVMKGWIEVAVSDEFEIVHKNVKQQRLQKEKTKA